MEPDLLERFAGIAAQAYTGEDVEVFGRRTDHLVRRPGQTERGTHWEVLLSSRVGGSIATAATTDTEPAGLRSTLDIARLMRRTVPQKAPDAGPLPALTKVPMRDPALEASDDDFHLRLPATATATATATVAQGTAAVWLVDSNGRAGCYTTGEAQITLRSPRGALGAALAASVSELDVAAALADLDREEAIHRLPLAGTGPKPSWLLLTPLATAQLLSHLSGGLLRAHYRESPVGDRIGSDAVTLIDDGTRAGVPFDDEGVPTRRTTVVESGQCLRLLSALADSTGNARRQDWSAHTAVAPSNLFLQPHGTLPGLDGTGLLVTRLSGVREAAMDLRHTPLRLTVHGATLRGGSLAERVQGVVEATARQILTGVVAVCGPMRFFRVTGVYGGATCLIDGLGVRLV